MQTNDPGDNFVVKYSELYFVDTFSFFWSHGQSRPPIRGKAWNMLSPPLSQQPGGDEREIVALQGGDVLILFILCFPLRGLVLALPGN